MKLIAALESAGQRVSVGPCSSEMVLWKAAGASHCAAGNFLISAVSLCHVLTSQTEVVAVSLALVRGVVSLLPTAVRVLRVQGKGLLSEASRANPFSANIIQNIPQKKAWLALAWRHFLYWFANAEHRLATGAVTAEDLVGIADANWAALETSKPRLLMEERQNTGDWVRQWRRALEEYPYFV